MAGTPLKTLRKRFTKPTVTGILSLSLSQTCVSCHYLLSLELGDEWVEECVVEVLSAEEGVAVGGLDLEDALLDLQDRNVEGAAAKVEHRDPAFETESLMRHFTGWSSWLRFWILPVFPAPNNPKSIRSRRFRQYLCPSGPSQTKPANRPQESPCKRASIKYVRRNFGFLDPLPPLSAKSRNLLYWSLVLGPLLGIPPLGADVLYGSPLKKLHYGGWFTSFWLKWIPSQLDP